MIFLWWTSTAYEDMFRNPVDAADPISLKLAADTRGTVQTWHCASYDISRATGIGRWSYTMT
jgi:hypothetical protein